MLKLLLHILISFPKTLYFNFICFPFCTAIRLPVLISYRVYLKNLHRGCIVIEGNPKFGFMKFGFGNGSFNMSKKSSSYLNIGKEGAIVLKGSISISNGSIINVSKGRIIFGENFISNANLKISCEKGISFGKNVLIGWNCTFIDGDGHNILDNYGSKINHSEEINIGNNVWFCAEATIFKGTVIPDNSVVSYGSNIYNKFSDNNCIIGGNPAKVLKRNINWEI
ncbi:acyltransferase [Bacillus sp. OTU530]|uniref:acyltransferase n=1 Tax=Bacillus sp. OTU530 TaxID=3043862 RepID=UPI00313B3F98